MKNEISIAEKMRAFTEKEIRHAFTELRKVANLIPGSKISVNFNYRLDTHQDWREENKLDLNISYPNGGGGGSFVSREHSLEEALATISGFVNEHLATTRIIPFGELGMALRESARSGNPLPKNFYRSYLALTQADKIRLTAVSAKAGVLIPNY